MPTLIVWIGFYLEEVLKKAENAFSKKLVGVASEKRSSEKECFGLTETKILLKIL